MSFDEIERTLGSQTVNGVLAAVHDAVTRSKALPDPVAGDAALQELLIILLAAIVVSPRNAATSRAEAAAERLTHVVNLALQQSRSSVHGPSATHTTALLQDSLVG